MPVQFSILSCLLFLLTLAAASFASVREICPGSEAGVCGPRPICSNEGMILSRRKSSSRRRPSTLFPLGTVAMFGCLVIAVILAISALCPSQTNVNNQGTIDNSVHLRMDFTARV